MKENPPISADDVSRTYEPSIVVYQPRPCSYRRARVTGLQAMISSGASEIISRNCGQKSGAICTSSCRNRQCLSPV